MSLLDVQERPAVIERINPSRYLISSSSIGSVPRNSQNLSALQRKSELLSGSSTAARIARKHANQPTGYSWATYAPTTSPQSSHSTSPINPPAQTSELVRLGTVDLRSVIRSMSKPASPVQTTIKARKTSPPSNAITPPAGTAPSLPPLSTPSTRPQSLPVVKSSFPRFQIPITPRPGPRLHIFHPDNTTALPEISRPSLLFIPNGPSPPPARRTTRARKPAAKAMALSLGLASDGSGLDGIETPSGENNINNNGGKGEKDRTSAAPDVTPVPALPPRSHKKKVVHRDEEPAVPESGGSEGSAPKAAASRRPPKRKAAAQAAEVMIMDFSGVDQDDAGKLGGPPAKRARRNGPDQHTAITHAPSPLSNEIARAEASPSPALPPPPPLTTVGSIANPKKRKADTPGSESADADANASTASPPPTNRPKTATSPGRPRAGSSSKTTQSKSKSTKKSDDGSKSSTRAESSSVGGDSGAEDKQKESEIPKADVATAQSKDKETKKDDEDDESDEDDVPPRRPYNMFEEPLELKPRPRPTYKAHLKRLSAGSFEDRPSRPRASKSKKSSSGSSRSQSRKESEDAQQQQVPTEMLTTTSPETEVRAFLPTVIQPTTVTVVHPSINSDAMDIDTPASNITQTGSTISVSIAV